MGCWWWEFVEFFRKYFLVSVAIYSSDGYPSSQIVFAVVICIFSIAIFQWEAPYIDGVDDVEAYMGYIILFFVFLIGLIHRVGSLLTTYRKILGETGQEFFQGSHESFLLSV